MSLSNISAVSIKEEREVQNLINSYIDKSVSLVFNAGAGSGKTYALMESLEYIIKKYGDSIMTNNQKIMCITYTNVATNEIKKRLGNSDLVKVSTIHERLWSLIKDYQKELIKIHVDKVREELNKLLFDLNENMEEKEAKQFKAYRDLSENSKNIFLSSMIDLKNDFYRDYDKSAKEFKAVFEKKIGDNPSLLTNVANFKKIVGTIYKIENYRDCLKQVESGNVKFKEVKYEDKYNQDVLHRMIISHDTLLEYALKMIKTYDLFRRVIFDSYPYILIDEYQDTNEKVIEIMKLIEDRAKSIKRKLFIGYFGDSAQNIYEDGVGANLSSIHPGLTLVNKEFNRRSHSEIIEVINKIRNDEIKQRSIYDDCSGGSAEFYIGSDEIKHQFVEEYKKKWNISQENKLHCLVLLNKFVAEFNSFPDIYRIFSETQYYKINYDRLNNELLSNDLSKLGDVPILFYRILEFIGRLKNPKTPISSLIDKNLYLRMTFPELTKLVDVLRSLKGLSLGEYIRDIFEKYEKSQNGYFKSVIQELIGLEQYSYQDFTNYLLDELFLNLGSEKLNDFKSKLIELFQEKLLKVETNKDESIRSKLEQFLGNEFFSCGDSQEVQEFKLRLYKFLEREKMILPGFEKDESFKTTLDGLFETEIFSLIDVDEVERAKAKLEELLNIKLDQWNLWYEFINDAQKADIIYHTYHGTKGAEFDNVIIFMENDFGRLGKNKFPFFFMHYDAAKTLEEKERLEFNNTRNLLYVSCSRAIKNLRILYLNDITQFKESIETIFGKILPYPESMKC